MGFVALGPGLVQGHGLGGFSGHAVVVKVDGVIEFILLCNDNEGIARHGLVHSDVKTEEKTNHNETEENDNNELIVLFHLPVIPGAMASARYPITAKDTNRRVNPYFFTTILVKKSNTL